MAIFSFGKKTTPLHLSLEKQAEDSETKKLQKQADVEASKEAVQRGIKKAQSRQKRKTFFRDLGRKSVQVSKRALVTTARATGKAGKSLAVGIYRASESGGKSIGRQEKQYLQQRFGKRPSYRRTARRRKSYSLQRQQPTFVQTTSGAFVQVAQPQQQRPRRPVFRRQMNRNVSGATGMDFLLGSGSSKSSRNGGYDDLISGGNGNGMDMMKSPRGKSQSFQTDIMSNPLGLNSSRSKKRRGSDDFSDLF